MAESDGGRPLSDAEGASSNDGDKKRKLQHCTFCKNHGVSARKKGHLCPHKTCDCPLCDLQKKAQVTMRHQQRVWRHQKQKLHRMSRDGHFQDEKSQVCDKCRNHNILTMKKNHYCPYDNCQCNYCSLTYKRRELMKHLQRVRRSNLTSDASETEHMIRAFEMEGKLSEKQLNAISKGTDVPLLSENCPPDSSVTCLEYHSLGGYPGSSTNSHVNNGYPKSTPFISPSHVKTISPPPLIPLMLSPPESPLTPITPSSSPTVASPGGCQHYHHLTPTTTQQTTSSYPVQYSKNRSTDVYDQTKFSSCAYYSSSNAFSSNSQGFEPENEEVYMQQCSWPPSPTVSDSNVPHQQTNASPSAGCISSAENFQHFSYKTCQHHHNPQGPSYQVKGNHHQVYVP